MHPVNRVLNLFGLRLSKFPPPNNGIPEKLEVRDTVEPMRVGRFDILMPPGHPAYEMFRDHPHYTSELGRIAAAAHAKYPDMVAVDVGANIGDTAAIIRTACPAPIICVEGDPTLQGILAENARRIGGVTIKCTFLSDSPGTMLTRVTKQGWNSTLVPSAGEDDSRPIHFVTLDEAMQDADRPRIKLLKIDTEGFDGRVMRGAPGLLSESRPVILFEYNRENLNALSEPGLEIFEYLRGLDYHALLIWDDRGRFLCGTSLDHADLLRDLHGYIDFSGRHLGQIAYLDVGVFHRDDADLAGNYLAEERRARLDGRGLEAVANHA